MWYFSFSGCWRRHIALRLVSYNGSHAPSSLQICRPAKHRALTIAGAGNRLRCERLKRESSGNYVAGTFWERVIFFPKAAELLKLIGCFIGCNFLVNYRKFFASFLLRRISFRLFWLWTEEYNARNTGLYLVTATTLTPLKLIIIRMSAVCGTGHTFNIHYSQVPRKHIAEHRQDYSCGELYLAVFLRNIQIFWDPKDLEIMPL